ncbi:MAG: hypothetical protein ACXWC9_09585, partial [Pseudobdellovibrionaceae bacterium]
LFSILNDGERVRECATGAEKSGEEDNWFHCASFYWQSLLKQDGVLVSGYHEMTQAVCSTVFAFTGINTLFSDLHEIRQGA